MKSPVRGILVLIVFWLVIAIPSHGYPVHATDGLTHQNRVGQASPPTDRILFTSTEFDVHGLFVMQADGSGRRALTETIGFDEGGVFSPDGQWIAFVSQRDDDHNGLIGRPKLEIYVMRPDGSDVRRLTNDPAWDSNPTWAADSRTVYFTSDRSGDFGVYRVEVDDPTVEPVTPRGSNYYSPHISPDGTQMLFATKKDGNWELYVMDLASLEEHRLTTSEFQEFTPRWSPDGSQIVYARTVDDDDQNADLYVMNADGSNVHQLTDHPEPDNWPAWSPDGTRIAFTSLRDWTNETDYMNGMEIYVMNADGSNVVRLTDNTFQDTSPEWFPNAAVTLAPEPTEIQYPGLSATMPQGLAATYYDEAMALLQAGDYETAIDVFSLAILSQPNSEVLYIGRGLAYYYFGDYDAAIDDASQAITLNRFLLGGYWVRGWAYLAADRLASAVSDGNQMVELWPDNYFGYELLAQVYFSLGNYETARENLELYYENDGPVTSDMSDLEAELDEIMALGPTPTPTLPSPTNTPALILVPDADAAFPVGTELTVPGPAPLTLRTDPSSLGGVSTFCSPSMNMTVLQTVETPDGARWVELACESGTGWMEEGLLTKFFE